jgi:hypothetical protein
MKKFFAPVFLVLALAFAAIPAEAFTYSTALKSARMTALATTWGNSAKLKIYDGGTAGTLCATFTLSATASDSATGGTATLTVKFTGNSASQTVAAVAACASADTAIITTSADVTVVDGLTVGTSGSDINLSNINIASGQNVSITAASFTHN